jgi:hypothetical protein
LIYQLAGMVGVDPAPLTLRELLWMADGKGRDEWARTALVCSILANCHRDPKKKPRPYTPAEFNPFVKKDKRNNMILITKDNVHLLREAFIGK